MLEGRQGQILEILNAHAQDGVLKQGGLLQGCKQKEIGHSSCPPRAQR